MSKILIIPYHPTYYTLFCSVPEAEKALDKLILQREKIKNERKIRKEISGISSKFGEHKLNWLRNQIRNVRAYIIRLEKKEYNDFLLWGC